MGGESGERIQKVLAHAGVASRRAAEALIAAGRVTVNGKPALIGQKVTPADAIAVDGRPVSPFGERLAYYALNKPTGVVTTARDEANRPTVLDYVRVSERVYPVGRLDADSEGLVLLTNDGELAHRLTHPRYQVPKVYEVTVQGRFEQPSRSRLLAGVQMEDGAARARRVDIIESGEESSLLRIVMTEGRKREIRNLCQAVGHPVLRLRRVAIDGLNLGTLAPGRWRPLSAAEVATLRRRAGLPERG